MIFSFHYFDLLYCLSVQAVIPSCNKNLFFYVNMNNVLLLWACLVTIIFDFLPMSFGRFILVEVDQKEVTRAKLGAGKVGKIRIIFLGKI